eukprot:TRINITY_DN3506_c0_g2_i5.p1 TRINITY_DN3506_c0_g2~~TRINITY_DN3506_c0_g2_i5.p1  ORF type:complete len:336 (+),score=31.60 TRINITY_DN3506_c0_g2_i5:88-1008(+)
MQDADDKNHQPQEQQQLNQGKPRKKFIEVRSRYLSTAKRIVSASQKDDGQLLKENNIVPPSVRKKQPVRTSKNIFDVDDGASCSSVFSQVTEAGRDTYQQFVRLLQVQLYQNLFWTHVRNINMQLLRNGQQEAIEALSDKVETIHKNQSEHSRLNMLIMKDEHDKQVDYILQTLLIPLEQWSNVNNQHKHLLYQVIQGMEKLMISMPLLDGANADEQFFGQAVEKYQDELRCMCAALLELIGDMDRLQQTTELVESMIHVFKEEELLIRQCTVLLEQYKNKSSQAQCLQCIQKGMGSNDIDVSGWL